jgi:hypothetical protein
MLSNSEVFEFNNNNIHQFLLLINIILIMTSLTYLIVILFCTFFPLEILLFLVCICF